MRVKVKGWGGMPNEGESGGLGEVWIMRVNVKGWGGMDNEGESERLGR